MWLAALLLLLLTQTEAVTYDAVAMTTRE